MLRPPSLIHSLRPSEAAHRGPNELVRLEHLAVYAPPAVPKKRGLGARGFLGGNNDDWLAYGEPKGDNAIAPIIQAMVVRALDQ